MQKINYPEPITEIIQPKDISLSTKLQLGDTDPRNNRWRSPFIIRPNAEHEDPTDPYDATIWWEIRDKDEQPLGIAKAYWFSAWDFNNQVKLIVTLRRMGNENSIIKRVKNFKTAKREALNLAIENCGYKETINRVKTMAAIDEYLIAKGKTKIPSRIFDRDRKKESSPEIFDLDNPNDIWLALIQGTYKSETRKQLESDEKKQKIK